jgi:hypothetical protein
VREHVPLGHWAVLPHMDFNMNNGPTKAVLVRLARRRVGYSHGSGGPDLVRPVVVNAVTVSTDASSGGKRRNPLGAGGALLRRKALPRPGDSLGAILGLDARIQPSPCEAACPARKGDLREDDAHTVVQERP